MDRRRTRPSADPTAEVLRGLLARLAARGYDRVLLLDPPDDTAARALVRGDRPDLAVFVLALAPGRSSAEPLPLPLLDEPPRFGVVGDGEVELAFDLGDPVRPLDRLPAPDEAEGVAPYRVDRAAERTLRQGHRLLRGLRDFRRQAELTDRERLNGPNDALLEAAKVLFLEGVRLRHGDRALFPANGKLHRLDEVLDVARVRRHGEQAAALLRAAFDHFKAQPEHVAVDDAGGAHPIFDAQTHLLLSQPRNLETLLAALPERAGRPGDAELLGRVFDRFVHDTFDGRAEGGAYLTPAPVREAMLAMAFHDFVTETPEVLTARTADGAPAFRFGDPACGAYGFGVRALDHLRQALCRVLHRDDAGVRADPWYRALAETCFYGADVSPMMVALGRVTMALLGVPRPRVVCTPGSLTGGPMAPCSLDLICTDPPFGAPRLPPSRRGEMDRLLESFRSDLHPGKRGGLVYEPTVAGLAMGGRPGAGGVWKPARPGSVDVCVLFLDRCLQLLKPGGRLLIVLPDGVLCNSGDRYVRQYLMGKRDEGGRYHGGKAIVRAVISLPPETLKSAGTTTKASILYLQKRRARPDDPTRFRDEPQGPVFMAVAESLSDPDDLAKIVAAYKSMTKGHHPEI